MAYTVELFSRVEEDVLEATARGHAQGRDHGRGAAHHRQPSGACIKAACRPCGVSSTPDSSTAPATRSTPSMEAGPMIRKGADEEHRGGSSGLPPTRTPTSIPAWPPAFSGGAQIGKGMWAMTDLMADMVEQDKIGHAEGGREYGVGAVADGGNTARQCTTTRSTSSRCRSNSRANPHRTIDELLAVPLAKELARAGAGGDPRGGRQQLPVHSGLRRPLDRRRRRLLESARYPRCRIDGRPCDAAYFRASYWRIGCATG